MQTTVTGAVIVHADAPSDVTSVFGKEYESTARQEKPQGDVTRLHDTLTT